MTTKQNLVLVHCNPPFHWRKRKEQEKRKRKCTGDKEVNSTWCCRGIIVRNTHVWTTWEKNIDPHHHLVKHVLHHDEDARLVHFNQATPPSTTQSSTPLVFLLQPNYNKQEQTNIKCSMLSLNSPQVLEDGTYRTSPLARPPLKRRNKSGSSENKISEI